MSEVEHIQEARPPKSEEEIQRALLAAKEAKTTIIAVAALTIGSIIFMFLITLVIVALKVL
jgi:FAD/FMN-containing dehydrogenase